MDKDFWKAFLAFLDDATDEEIRLRLADTQELLANGIQNPGVRGDAKRIVKFLEQEVMSRRVMHR